MIKPIALYGVEIWGLLTPAMLKKKLELYDLFKDWEYEKLNLLKTSRSNPSFSLKQLIVENQQLTLFVCNAILSFSA
jgi:hypothetical protein